MVLSIGKVELLLTEKKSWDFLMARIWRSEDIAKYPDNTNDKEEMSDVGGNQ